MKLLLNIFKKVRPNFEDDGKLVVFKPLYEAMENFFFAPSSTTLVAPFARDPLDVKRYMSMVIIALLPVLAASVYFFGLRVLAMVMVSYVAGGIVEVAFGMIRKEPIAEGFLVTGMIFPMILPPTTPLWMVAVGVIFGVFAGKELFGGTGRNVFNPAIVGRCFLVLAYPNIMSSNWVIAGNGVGGRLLQYITTSSADALTAATPLVHAKGGHLEDISHMLMGSISGCVAETSGLMIICGGIYLILSKVANWRTVAGILLAAFGLETILNLSNPDVFAPAIWHIFAGGLLFGAFFMATDPVSSPITNTGKWIYGILIGTITILIRNFTGYVEGMMFAILLGNIFAPILDEIVFKFSIGRLKSEG